MLSAQRAIFIAGLLFLTAGTSFLALDQWRFSQVLGEMNLAGSPDAREQIKMEEGLSDLREAEEYLAQNSLESAQKAHDRFVHVLSRDLGKDINQRASYGIAASLDRLGDRNRAVEHLRSLRGEGVQDKDLREKTEYLLGRLLILFGHDEEGKSILQELLASTQNNLIKSRIHTTFGDYYRLTGQKKKAERNYRIALEYSPGNLHAEVERAELLDDNPRIRYYYHEDYLIDSSLKKKNEKPASQTQRPVRKPRKETRPEKEDSKEKPGNAQALYEAGIKHFRDKQYPEAVSKFQAALKAGPDSELREKVLYWMAESLSAGGEKDQALEYYTAVIENPALSLDQAAYIQRGIILFDRAKVKEAYEEFKKAASQFPEGAYTNQALEWQREVENILQDRERLKN
ncbi:MAG TPA: hypothetical protein DEA96_13565 [Leptospiraceae bacterium]|nr:hypothetical protein [Spirochaetaceae bacterium]HBS05990.1 hypothetical protein [Leptospiraceae bacterium]|tara:strand:+ start:1289 stop:2491 length:1203 start_codon:yes stop_codon:yes gene_type:complete